MKILKRITVPTGDILIVDGDNGKLECLSLGDYGKDVNLNQNKIVPDGLQLLPLSKKWVITVSTQYGCSMGCNFCDVPKVGSGKNATGFDLINQVITGLRLHPDIKYSDRLNIHFARMGEPTWNYDVIRAAKWFAENLSHTVHPVVSTMMPKKNNNLVKFLQDWMKVKNEVYEGNAGLQLSINSTNPIERDIMFNGNAMPLPSIGNLMDSCSSPVGRKITLNFAVADYDVEPEKLLPWFNPRNYIIKLTPMHKTKTALEADIKTEGDYTNPEPYQELDEKFKKAGYETLVFIASNEEDLSRITCGNAILSDEVKS
jgi:23S rRNA (adenine2503-C2)-methyltransferase